jgi:hypothetical protein
VPKSGIFRNLSIFNENWVVKNDYFKLSDPWLRKIIRGSIDQISFIILENGIGNKFVNGIGIKYLKSTFSKDEREETKRNSDFPFLKYILIEGLGVVQ